MIITRTPYRLSFFGGGTDYNPWFEKNGGLVIGSTINKYCYISIRNLPPFFDHKSRIVYSQTEQVTNHDEIDHPSVRACLQYMDVSDGVEIHYDGDLPARSGIGSSSSFTVGLLKGLHAYRNKMVGKEELAREAIHVEQNVIGENIGIQDQTLASFGGMQVIRMGPGKDFKVEPLIISNSYKKSLESHFLLAFSGIHRIASKSAGEQINKIKDGALNPQLSEICDIAREGLSLLSHQDDISKIGSLFDKTWKLKKTLTSTMSNSDIDDIYDTAIRNGAYGGRMLGAGNGGFLVFIAPPEKHQRIIESLPQVKVWVPFNFEDNGSQVLFYNNEI